MMHNNLCSFAILSIYFQLNAKNTCVVRVLLRSNGGVIEVDVVVVRAAGVPGNGADGGCDGRVLEARRGLRGLRGGERPRGGRWREQHPHLGTQRRYPGRE